MNLENMISEITRLKSTNIVRFHLYEGPTIIKFIDRGSRIVVTRGRGERILGNYCQWG